VVYGVPLPAGALDDEKYQIHAVHRLQAATTIIFFALPVIIDTIHPIRCIWRGSVGDRVALVFELA